MIVEQKVIVYTLFANSVHASIISFASKEEHRKEKRKEDMMNEKREPKCFKDERDEMEHIGEKREGDVSIGGGDTMQMLNREICCDW